MKKLASTLSPEYMEYSAQKAAGILKQTHLKPLSEIFTQEQLSDIPVDNKVGENYFGQMTAQLRKKGGAAFSVIGERLVLSSNADLAFTNGAEKMLKDKELKCQKKQVDKIEAEWSKAQKDIMKAKIDVTDSEADILAREQSKNKLIAQCAENGRKHNYHGPVTSQDDVNLMFAKIQKFSEQDKLSLMRKEIKVKKLIFSELPNDFVLFKQYNISSTKMYQNLLELHAVDSSNQEIITVEDIYEGTNVLASNPTLERTQSSKKSAKPRLMTSEEPFVDLEWPPSEEEFFIALLENEWSVCSVISYDEASDTIKAHLLQAIKTRAKDDTGKTYWIYSEEENVDTFEEKHVLAMRPSINLAKNIKRRDPVFALMNREVIEGMTSQFYN